MQSNQWEHSIVKKGNLSFNISDFVNLVIVSMSSFSISHQTNFCYLLSCVITIEVNQYRVEELARNFMGEFGSSHVHQHCVRLIPSLIIIIQIRMFFGTWSFMANKTLRSFINFLKGAPTGLRQFLATKSPLKMMKNVFHFTLKSLFILEIFAVLSWLFGHVEKRLD